MIDLSHVRLQEHHREVEWSELDALFTLVDLRGRGGDKLRRAFLNSTAVTYAFDGQRLIGSARAISDGEYHAVIYDVAVHPGYQRRGVGSMVMRHLLGQLPVWRVMLVASPDVQVFYGGFGFAAYADVMAKLDWGRLDDPTPGVERAIR